MPDLIFTLYQKSVFQYKVQYSVKIKSCLNLGKDLIVYLILEEILLYRITPPPNTSMTLYSGLYRFMANLTLYRHAGVSGIVRYDEWVYLRGEHKGVDTQLLGSDEEVSVLVEQLKRNRVVEALEHKGVCREEVGMCRHEPDGHQQLDRVDRSELSIVIIGQQLARRLDGRE